MKAVEIVVYPEAKWTLSSTDTRRVADLLESSEKFNAFIKKARKTYKIPAEGFLLNISYKNKLLHDTNQLDKLLLECEDFVSNISLPFSWSETVAMFALHNIFVAPRNEPVEIYAHGSKIVNMVPFSKDDCLIVIKEKISKSELHKMIDSKWNLISKAIKYLPKTKTHKMIRSELAKKIVEMRDDENKTFKEICNYLSEQFKEDTEIYDLISEDYVKLLYHRWKKKKM